MSESPLVIGRRVVVTGLAGSTKSTFALALAARIWRKRSVELGDTALVAVTGLRNPCAQIEGFQPGLLNQVGYRDGEHAWVRRAGVMGVVVFGGVVRVGDGIEAQPPPGPPQPLERV